MNTLAFELFFIIIKSKTRQYFITYKINKLKASHTHKIRNILNKIVSIIKIFAYIKSIFKSNIIICF